MAKFLQNLVENVLCIVEVIKVIYLEWGFHFSVIYC